LQMQGASKAVLSVCNMDGIAFERDVGRGTEKAGAKIAAMTPTQPERGETAVHWRRASMHAIARRAHRKRPLTVASGAHHTHLDGAAGRDNDITAQNAPCEGGR
jgi:hypothetical protein